jgi:hypothetical protein
VRRAEGAEPLALGELVPLVGFDEQLDDAGLHDAARDRHVDRVGPFGDNRHLASRREQMFEEKIESERPGTLSCARTVPVRVQEGAPPSAAETKPLHFLSV